MLKTTIDLDGYNIVKISDDINMFKRILNSLSDREKERFKYTFFQDMASSDNIECFKYLIKIYGLDWANNCTAIH